MDTLTKQQRARCMSRIRSKGTRPEIIVRKVLTKLGWRYRLHIAKLQGRPDIVIPKNKTALFINGCFWHQHKGCKRQSIPKTNVAYWEKKLKGNVERQKKDIKVLRKLGWRVRVIWECQTKQEDHLEKKLRSILYDKKCCV